MDRDQTHRWLSRALAFTVLAFATCFLVLSIHEQPRTRTLQPVTLLASPSNPNAFLSTWNTTLTSAGSSAYNQIKLPLVSNGTYNFVVAWGDGTTNTITTWNQAQVTHTYASAGVYALNITGTVHGWAFNDGGDRLKLIGISQWGLLQLGNSGLYFCGCSNLVLSATGAPNLSGTTTLEGCFENCINLGSSGNMNSWDVSHVRNMWSMFANSSFNQPIGSWNVSNVRNMVCMFYYDTTFDQPIGSWNVSHVTEMSGMFKGIFWHTSSFNQPIGSWNVSDVTDMSYMFESATSFNQPIGAWDVSRVTDMESMFAFDYSFNQPIGAWNVSRVTDMLQLFYSDDSFNQPIGAWNVSKVAFIDGMFYQDYAFDQPIGAWNVSRINDMSSMFSFAMSFNQSLGTWDVSHVKNMEAMFQDDFAFNQPIGAWNVASVTDMDYMFNGATSFDQPIGTWNVSRVTEMQYFFQGGTLSVANYDNLLVSWSKEALQHNVIFDAGHSCYSNTVAADRASIISGFNWTIMDGGVALPSMPQNLVATAGNSRVTLSWVAPDNNGGNAITNYSIYMGMSSGSETLLTTVGNMTTYTATGLTNGQSYYFTVAAETVAGTGANSSEAVATPAKTVGIPQGLAASAGDGMVILSWLAPTDNGGLAITNYSIYMGTSSGSETLLVTIGNVTTYTVKGLINGNAYYFEVSAVNGAGVGALSVEVMATPTAGGPSVPGFPIGVTFAAMIAACAGLATELKRRFKP